MPLTGLVVPPDTRAARKNSHRQGDGEDASDGLRADAIGFDLLFLTVFSLVTMGLVTSLFKRTL
jgi:hypothetical protein